MKKPEFRCGTRKAIDELAIELGLPESHQMQDWSYEVASLEDFDRYLAHYKKTTDDDKKFVLMEMLIQAVNDQQDESDFARAWQALEPILLKDFKIHEFTIFYWACLDKLDVTEAWAVTPKIRVIWHSGNKRWLP